MGKRNKLLASIKRNPKNVAFEDIDLLLKYYGCSVRQKGRGSSHYIYTHPAVPNMIVIPRDKPIKAIYAKRALEMIDLIKEVLENE